MSVLDAEIAVYRGQLLQLHLEAHSDRATLLRKVSTLLDKRFSQRGGMADLEEALSLGRSALELCPPGHPDHALSLNHLADCLLTHFNQLGQLSDLDEALSLYHSVLEHRPSGHPDHTLSLNNLADCLSTRFKQLGQLSDLEEALSLERSILELRPPGHPDRARSLGNIAICLFNRFNQLGRLSDLEEALSLYRSVLELRPSGHLDHARILVNIANCLSIRFNQLGHLPDLEEALSLHRSALEPFPPTHPDRPLLLNNLASCLYNHFTQLGQPSDLEEALSLYRSALELCPPGHADRLLSLSNLAISLSTRFSQLGRLSDLDEALSLNRSALELWSPGHPEKAISLGNLAGCLCDRFHQLGRLTDLEEALSLYRSALELRPPGHPDHARSLNDLAICLYTRFKRLGQLSDLEEALSFNRSALKHRPSGQPDRVLSLNNLASCLRDRFSQLGRLSDLEEALSLNYSALDHRPPGHPDRAHSLANIAGCLYTRFKQLGQLSDLEEALSFDHSALELRPLGHPDRAHSLGSLACSFHARFEHSPSHSASDLNETFNLYSQLSDLSQTVSSADLECCKQWIRVAEEHSHYSTILAYQTFLRLGVHHLAALPSLPQNLPLLKRLITTVPVDAFSACLRHGSPTNAVELLEQGRGVFWNQLIRLRSPVDDLAASGDAGKQLADKFTQVVTLLRTLHNSPSNAKSLHDRAIHLNIELRDVIAAIRNLPGYSRFLLPPHFPDLQVAAAGGPVIIVNASWYSCDALILLSNKDPIHVVLPITKARVSELSSELYSLLFSAKFMDMTREIMIFLRHIWDEIVSPIVNVLQQSCPLRSRIWWCPTAEFSLLPLHAACPYRKGQPMFSNLYMSSYTPTLTALIRARQQSSLDPPTEQHRFLVVGQAQALGQSKLASVSTELTIVSQRVGSVARVVSTQGQDANIGKVGEEFHKNDFVHLACHGVPNQKHPFESGFALGDGLLKIEDIMQYDLRNAKFAYLSACHTTVGDQESPDEVIHLAAAMQFAGFRSVIGTMWAVDDAHTNEITSIFYDHMVDESGHLDHTRAALALHKTMKSIRSSSVPLDQQILYIHIGV